eukprot:g3097.t1
MRISEARLDALERAKEFQGYACWIVDVLAFNTKGSLDAYVKCVTEHQSEARLVMRSLAVHSIFATTFQSPKTDAVVVFRYPSVKAFTRFARTNVEFKRMRTDTLRACETYAVAVPRSEAEIFDPTERNATAFSRKLKTAPSRDGETQEIMPDLEMLQRMLQDDSSAWRKGRDRPIWAFNMLRFLGSPEARDNYYAYGRIAERVITKKGTSTRGPQKSEGLILRPAIAFTLIGRCDWDEIVIMRYASLSSFLALSQQKEWEKAHERYRSKGLLKQGLMLIAPDPSKTKPRGVSRL